MGAALGDAQVGGVARGQAVPVPLRPEGHRGIAHLGGPGQQGDSNGSTIGAGEDAGSIATVGPPAACCGCSGVGSAPPPLTAHELPRRSPPSAVRWCLSQRVTHSGTTPHLYAGASAVLIHVDVGRRVKDVPQRGAQPAVLFKAAARGRGEREGTGWAGRVRP